MLDKFLTRVTANERITHSLIPVLRSYLRYSPIAAGKRSFWTRVVNPYFAWESHKFVAPTLYGSRVAGDTREILQQYIYYFGIWEPHITSLINRRLRPGDVFVDVGANIGYYSLLTSKLVGESGSVVAVEASPKIFSALQSNITRNRASNIRAVNVAVSDSEGILKLYHGPETHVGLTTTLEEEGLKHGYQFECEVQAAPLNTILQPHEAKNAKLVKIDVEGAEWSVIAGMSSLLSSGRDDLEVIVEINPERLAQQGKCTQDIVDIFSERGFYPYRLENDYCATSHIPPLTEKRPVRIHPPIRQEMDVLFSRRDEESISIETN